MEKEVYLTAKGLEALKIELDDLKINKRTEIAEQIKTAREFGDLSENAEYDAAKEEQGKINARIAEIEAGLRNVVIIDENVKSDKIQPGSTVTIYDKEFKETETYTIVGVSEADPSNNKLSNESPIGAAIIGKKKGDIVSVKTPGGIIEIEIISID
ncbi:MAG: transcription elongation factor GreA [Bacillota bacterium]